MITQPLLAVHVKDFSKLVYPIWCTPKIDGIRCLRIGDKAVSRKFLPIPNRYIRSVLEAMVPEGFDGEIIPGGIIKDFGEVTSAVMKFDGEPQFRYCVFDYVKDGLDKPYTERMRDLRDWFSENWKKTTKFVVRELGDPYEEFFESAETPMEEQEFRTISNVDVLLPLIPEPIESEEELLAYEEKCLSEGYEGVMIRRGDGIYKCGRSTEKQQILLKLKRFEDAEAKVIGFEEKETNLNEKEKDAFGHAKRSSKKEGKMLANTLGAFLVRDIKTGAEFSIGTGLGLTNELRKKIWENREEYIGKLVKYKSQKAGAKDSPRIPVYLGFRDEKDL